MTMTIGDVLGESMTESFLEMRNTKDQNARRSMLAPWLSWLKRLSSKQEIPSSNLGGASRLFKSQGKIKTDYIVRLSQPGIELGTFRS